MPSKRLWIIFFSSLGTLLFTMLILVGSPFFLQWMGQNLSVNWRLVGSVSQAFTGTSTALAAAGLFVLAVSIFLQTNQLRLSRGHSLRDLQFRMLEMAMKDKVLADTYFQFKPISDFDDFRRIAYIEMRLRYMEFSFIEGLITEEVLRYTVSSQFFSVPFMRGYWERVSPVWAAETTTKKEVAFVRILCEEHVRIATHNGKESNGR